MKQHAEEGQLTAEAEVGSEAGKSVPYTAKNVTNDANLEMGGWEVTGGKQVVEAPTEFNSLIGAISACRERRDDRFRTPATGRRLIEEAIFSRGPLLRQIE